MSYLKRIVQMLLLFTDVFIVSIGVGFTSMNLHFIELSNSSHIIALFSIATLINPFILSHRSRAHHRILGGILAYLGMIGSVSFSPQSSQIAYVFFLISAAFLVNLNCAALFYARFMFFEPEVALDLYQLCLEVGEESESVADIWRSVDEVFCELSE
jgi:uncharacterized membrane protein YhaH (DUF805 family)